MAKRRGQRRPPPPTKTPSVATTAEKTGAKKRGTKSNTKNRNNNNNNNVHDDVPSSRTWIYAATTTSSSSSKKPASVAAYRDSEEEREEEHHERYLHRRVRRCAVRSLPANYSYFRSSTTEEPSGGRRSRHRRHHRHSPPRGSNNDEVVDGNDDNNDGSTTSDDDDGGETTVKAVAGGDASNVSNRGGNGVKIQQSLDYTHVPLPPEETLDNNDDATKLSSSAYSEFCSPTVVKDTRLAKFQFSLNYSTHVPNKNLISYVGTSSSNIGNGNVGVNSVVENETGYVLQMPLIKGTVVGYSPPLDSMDDYEDGGLLAKEDVEFPTERQRVDEPLFRILWDGHSSSNGGNDGVREGDDDGGVDDADDLGTSTVVGYTEDLTLSELLPALVTDDNSPEPSLSKQSKSQLKLSQQTALSIHKHVHATTCRKQLSLEWKMECELLPHMVVLAALELRREVANKVRFEMLLERKRLRMASGLDSAKGSGRKKKSKKGEEEEVINKDGAEFGYYSRHPNQYMSSFAPPPPLPSDDEDSDIEDGEGGFGKSSRTKLTKDELDRYNERVEELCRFAPSKIAERVRAACSLAYEYAVSQGLLEEYYVECAMRNAREREEKDLVARNAGVGVSNGEVGGRGGRGGAMDAGEVRRSARARTSVNYAEDRTAKAEEMLSREGDKEDRVRKSSSLPKENACGGPTARYLLDLLGMLPDEEDDGGSDAGDHVDSDDDDGDTMEEEEEEEEEEDNDDPFFEPNRCLIIDQLGRKHRYMSPGAIQSAIVRAIEGEAVETPVCLLDEEEAERQHGSSEGTTYVTDIVVTTDDKVADLPQFEPASFARCRFASRTYLPESEEDEDDDAVSADGETSEQMEQQRLASEASLRRKAERKIARKARERERNAELERAYRAKKAFELWRFRSVHGDGCTVWPSWSVHSRELLRDGGNGLGGVGFGRSSSEGALPSTSTSAGNEGESVPPANDGVEAASSVGVTANGAGMEASGAETSGSKHPPADLPAAAAAVQKDEELARSLAAAEVAATSDSGNDLPLAKRRRTTRRGAAAGSSSEPVFYGGYQSMTRDQLLDTLTRLLRQASLLGGSSSLMDLKRLVFPENYETSRGGQVEMKKLRSALGHLVYKLGRVGRLVVDVEGGDEVCWEVLREQGPLVKFISDVEDDVSAGGGEDGGGVISGKEDTGVKLEKDPAKAVTPGDANEETIAVKSSLAPAPPPPSSLIPMMDSHLRSQLFALEEYIADLHRTELTLRKGLMKVIDKNGGGGNTGSGANTLLQLSTWAIATAADEVEGAVDAEDWRFFLPKSGANSEDEDEDEDEDESHNGDSKIKWSNDPNDHVLLGQVIYRPPSSPLRPAENDDILRGSNEKCHWYRIVLYTPSIKAVEAMDGGDVNSSMHAPSTISQSNPLNSVSVGEKDKNDNTIVKRRMRFRAVPVAESDIEVPYSEVMEEMDIEDEDIEYMVLTEAQARAGVEASALHRRIENKRKKSSSARKHSVAVSTRATCAQHHPYRNGHGSRVMLTPVQDEGDDSCNGPPPQFEVLYGLIAGHTTTVDFMQDNEMAKHKLLVLLEEVDSNKNKNGNEDEDDSDGLSTTSRAVWATVDNEGTFLTEISLDNIQTYSKEGEEQVARATSIDAPQFCARYSIDMHEFYQGSPAYTVCESMVSYLKNHSKSGPFLHPVDPIALGIPDYPTVVKNPMDISTLADNLEDGKYSRIPSTNRSDDDYDAEDLEDDGTETPVYRMAYGPFFDDIMLIFDNCIRFNGDKTWIGNEAAIFKKNVIKKMEQVVSKAVWSGKGGMTSGAKNASSGITGASSSRRANKKSIYTDEDSDADVYEYESEYEDDDGGGGKRGSRKSKGNGRSRSSKKKVTKEDIPSKAIEQPFWLPENVHDFGTGGSFPHLKIQTNVGKFSLSQAWSCRYINSDASNEDGGNEEGDAGKEAPPAEDEMMMLLKMQQEEDDAGTIRRSSRARNAPKNYADEEVLENPTTTIRSYAIQAPITLPGVEYYLVNGDVLQPKKKALPEKDGREEEEGDNNTNHSKDRDADAEERCIPTVCRSRLGAEGVHETIHERFYAKLYRDYSPDALILDSGVGKYANGSFPPYLGRVIPTTMSTAGGGGLVNDEGAMIWEIREQYLVPALRWILRGLVHSGHLEEVDGSLSEGVLDDAPARTSFGAGIVVPNHEYYYNDGGMSSLPPFDVLDEKEILRKRRQDAAVGASGDSSSEEEVELSAYEQMRADRVARNAERLKALGLA